MIHIFVRRSSDVEYLTGDRADELADARRGAPGWWLRGTGDAHSSDDVAAVLQTTARATVVGYDVVVAAPRPLSILIALDAQAASGVVAAHRTGVLAAIDYLEDRALVVRQRVEGGEYLRRANWSRVVGFTHGINRSGEPHLHDHVLVGARPDHESTVADSRSLFAHLPAADALYRATLRFGVNQHTARTAWRSFAGVEGVSDLDEGYRAIWGGHADERGEKPSWTREEVVARWSRDQRRFEPYGVIREPPRRFFDPHQFAATFEGATRIARRDLVRAFADASTFGAEASVVGATIDELHPHLRTARGLDERPVSLTEARRLTPEVARNRSYERSSGIDDGRYLERVGVSLLRESRNRSDR